MKYLILLTLLSSCSVFTPSISRCDNLIGLEKEICLVEYHNFRRHLDYRRFRGVRRSNY